MNPNATYKQTKLNFKSRTSQDFENNNDSSDESIAPPSSGRPEDLWTPLPPALARAISELARKYASIACKAANLGQKIGVLHQHKTNGTIPDHLKFKFKKLVDSERDTALHAAMIDASITNEIEVTRGKIVELTNLFNNRMQDLINTLGPAINSSNLSYSQDQITDTFDNAIRETKLQFILKQQKDDTKKNEKKQKFLLQQEAMNEVATLSIKQVQSFKKEIISLKKQLKDLSKSSQKNKKGTKKPKNSKGSTGTSKNKGGSKPGSSKNK
jgi:hypothetical protein